MAKELPYFKFYPGEWLKGDITLCSMEAQGLFINICNYYWMKDCNMSLTGVQQRFNTKLTELNELIKLDVISIEEDILIINFLDEQMSEFDEIREKRSLAGKRSAEVKKSNKRSTSVKQEFNYKEKSIVDKDKIKERQQKFKVDIEGFLDKYTIEMLTAFYAHWSEPNKTSTKMRCEMEKTWDTKRRLVKWNSNNEHWGKGSSKKYRNTETEYTSDI